MEEELVSVSSSIDERGGVGDHPTSLFAYHFPFYLSLGMTYEQFYYGDYTLVLAYREAYKLKLQERNQELWLQGLYVLEAIASSNSKDHKYPKEPFPIDREEQEKRAERDRRERAYRYMQTFMNKKEGEDG